MSVTPAMAYCRHGYCETEHCRACEICGECKHCEAPKDDAAANRLVASTGEQGPRTTPGASQPSLIEVALDVTMAALVSATADAFGPVRKRGGGKGANRDLSKCGALSSEDATRPTGDKE